MNLSLVTHVRLTGALLFGGLLLAGCSSSGGDAPPDLSDSGAGNAPGRAVAEPQPGFGVNGREGVVTPVDDRPGGNVPVAVFVPDAPAAAGTPTERDTPAAMDGPAVTDASATPAAPTLIVAPVSPSTPAVPVTPDSPVMSSPVTSTPVAPDAAIRDTTRVTLEITVPAYVSNSLRVTVDWRDKTRVANWIGDEFWSVTDDFSREQGGLLVVTFFDRNGAVTLGSAEQAFLPEATATQTHRVTQDDFNTHRWDDDGDGISNLDELLAGSDPLIDDSVPLVLRFGFHDQSIYDMVDALRRVTSLYEARIPAARPHDVSTNEDGGVGEPATTLRVAIDESGWGRYSKRSELDDDGDITIENEVADRSVVDGTVIWTGSYLRTDSRSGVFDDIAFSTATSVVDERHRRQTGEIERSYRTGSSAAAQTISYDLTFDYLDGFPTCVPVAGIITNDQAMGYEAVTTFSRERGEFFWTVTVLDDDRVVDEYLVDTIDTQFYCGFADLP